MERKWMDKLEETFMEYTRQYDENIKNLIKDKQIELSMEELEEILHDAKYMVLKAN